MIQAWLQKYGVWTHILAVVGLLVAAFDAVPQFHDLVMATYNSFPPSLMKWIAVALAVYGWYRQGHPTGTIISTPATKDTPSMTRVIGVWALIALLLPLPFATGCSGITVAQDIVNWTPALQSAVATIDSTASLLAPADAPIFTAATVGFDAASNLLVGQAKAYLANPTASILAQLQTQAVTFQQQVNASVLAAARIVDPNSQQHALAVIGVVVTVVNAIMALVQSISSKAAVAQMAAASTIKLAKVLPYLDQAQAAQILAAHYKNAINFPAVMTDGSFGAGSAAESIGLTNLQAAGF